MIFGPKTTHYLRTSRGTVLPLHLYLDDRHVEWMTERTLQYVLTDLRPLIREKLEVERPFLLGAVSTQAIKQFASKVETHRGGTYPEDPSLPAATLPADSYQFGWWFTKAEPHAVVLKTRTFVQAPTAEASEEPTISTSKQRPRKRNRAITREGKGKAPSVVTGKDHDADVEAGIADADKTSIDVDAVHDSVADPIRASSRRPVKMEEVPEQLHPQNTDRASTRTVTVDFEMGAEEEDETKKPVLQLKFMSMRSRLALCVVVEPYPPLPVQRRQPSIFSAAGIRAMTRAPSEAPSLLAGPHEANRNREPTPLFLPDFDRQSATTPAPFFRQPSLPAVPTFDDDGEPMLEDEGPAPNLVEFSHSLQATAAARGGTPEEDQANDVLYGDADDMRTGR